MLLDLLERKLKYIVSGLYKKFSRNFMKLVIDVSQIKYSNFIIGIDYMLGYLQEEKGMFFQNDGNGGRRLGDCLREIFQVMYTMCSINNVENGIMEKFLQQEEKCNGCIWKISGILWKD